MNEDSEVIREKDCIGEIINNNISNNMKVGDGIDIMKKIREGEHRIEVVISLLISSLRVVCQDKDTIIKDVVLDVNGILVHMKNFYCLVRKEDDKTINVRLTDYFVERTKNMRKGLENYDDCKVIDIDGVYLHEVDFLSNISKDERHGF